MSRERRERQAERRRAESPQESLWNRRSALVAGSAGVITLLGLNLERIRNAFNPNFSSTRPLDLATKYGEVVFDQQTGEPNRLFECWKQVHPGPTMPLLLQRNEKKFESFVQHQENITDATIAQINEGEPGMTHVFLEGFVGEPEEWGDASEMLDATTRLQRILGDPGKRSEGLKALWASVQAGDASAVNLLYSGGRIVAFCKEKGLNIVHGADPVNHPNLMEGYHEVLDSLVRGTEEPTDEILRHSIQFIQKMAMNDEAIRHEYIRKTMTDKVPEKGTGILILGASHFEAGVNFEKPSFPLEKVLAQTPNTRTVVIQEINLPILTVVPERTLMLGSKSLRPEDLRTYIKMMRTKRDMAK